MAWQPHSGGTLDSLRDLKNWDGTPWREGDRAVYQGMGGMNVLGKRHETLAKSQMANYVQGDRHLVVNDDMNVYVEGNQQLGDAADAENPTAIDSLVVEGDMRWKMKDRVTIGIGTVDRAFHGVHFKLSGMEGVICGGAWNRTYAGTLLSLSALKMSDVFGGAVMAAGARVNIHDVLYRSADYSYWEMGTYKRHVTHYVEPEMGTKVPYSKKGRRRDIAQAIAFTIFPPLGMAFALIMAPFMIFALSMFAYRKLRRIKGKPYTGEVQPKMRFQTVGGSYVAARQGELIA